MAAKLVEVRPLNIKKWHGKKGKESFSRPIKLGALIDSETGLYATGITQKDIEKLGEMNFNIDLSNVPLGNGKPHPTWDSKEMMIELKNQTMFFNPNLPREYVKICIMRASKYVANSLKEFEEGLYPYATHYIHDDASAAEVSATKIATRNKAISVFGKLPKERKLELCLILGGKDLKNQSNDYVDVSLDEILNKDPEEFLRYAEKEDKALVSLLALVENCLLKNVLRKEGHKIMYADSILGGDKTEVAEYLSKDENQELRLHLISKVS